MLNKAIHRKFMYDILKDIFDSGIGKSIAFKGGTLCYFIYNLDRFSTDLDFDIIGNIEEKIIYDMIKSILLKKGIIKEEYNKRYTIFFLFSYLETDMNIKIELNKRIWKNNKYEIINFFGTDIYAMEKKSMFSNKLVALTDRKKIANRDLYDIYFFYKNNFEVNQELVLERTGMTYKDYLVYLKDFISKIKSKNILSGLGEVLDNKQKAFVKNKLLIELTGIIDFNLHFLP